MTNKSEQPAREFWLQLSPIQHEGDILDFDPESKHYIHVIEYSSYLAEKEAREKAESFAKEMQEAKDLLVDRLAEFTIGKEINGGECLLINKLQPKVDQLKEKLEVAKEALKVFAVTSDFAKEALKKLEGMK